jgi:Leucine-rich repeat (LRR) protein
VLSPSHCCKLTSPRHIRVRQNAAVTSFDQLELTIDCQLMTRSESSGKKLFAEIDVMLIRDKRQLDAVDFCQPAAGLGNYQQSTCRRSSVHLSSAIVETFASRQQQLRRLPGDCFIHLTQLVNLTAVDNEISELQDGLFDGLSKLELIDFSNNHISSIGRRVFINESDLLSLHTIRLDSNLLKEIDAWPIVRGRAVGTYSRPVFVGLAGNFHIKDYEHGWSSGWLRLKVTDHES